jgi:hypothetical protein
LVERREVGTGSLFKIRMLVCSPVVLFSGCPRLRRFYAMSGWHQVC